MSIMSYVWAISSGILIAIIAFLILYIAVFANISKDMVSDIIDRVGLIISFVLAIAGGVFGGIGVFSAFKSDTPTCIELMDGTVYDESIDEIEDVKDSSSDKHPNRFTVIYTDGKEVEIPRRRVHIVKFYDGSKLEIENKDDECFSFCMDFI